MANYIARGTICLRHDEGKSVVLFTPQASSTVEGRQVKRALFLSSVLYEAPALGELSLTKKQRAALRTLSLTQGHWTKLQDVLASALSLTDEQKEALRTALSLATEQLTALIDSDNDMVQKRLDNEGKVILGLPTCASSNGLATAVANAGKSLVEVKVSRAGEGGELTLESLR